MDNQPVTLTIEFMDSCLRVAFQEPPSEASVRCQAVILDAIEKAYRDRKATDAALREAQTFERS